MHELETLASKKVVKPNRDIGGIILNDRIVRRSIMLNKTPKSHAIGRDFGLTARMALTLVMLGMAYVALFGLLLIAGINPIIVIVLGIAMVFFQYYMSDKLVLTATKAKVVTEEEQPRLHEMIDRISAATGIPKPKKIAIMDEDVPNAFATGRNPRNSTVAVTTGLISKLNNDELEAVIGHELAHIKNRDVMVMTWASLIIVIAGYLMQMMFWMSLFGGFGGHRRSGGGQGNAFAIMMLVYVGVILVYFVSQMLIMTLSRYREFAADRGGVSVTGNPSALASALRKISDQMSLIPEKDLRHVEHANAFFIIPVLKSGFLSSMGSSHPPTEKRIQRLLEMENTLRSG